MAAVLAGSPLSAQPDSPAARSSSGGGAASTPPSAKSRLGGVLSPFRRALGSGSGRGSPLGSSGGAGGTPPPPPSPQPQSGPGAARSLLPSYGHAVAKREIIRAQEEQLAALRLQLGQLEEEAARWAAAECSAPPTDAPSRARPRVPPLNQTHACGHTGAAPATASPPPRRLRTELASERGAREALQERLNLQFFKARWVLLGREARCPEDSGVCKALGFPSGGTAEGARRGTGSGGRAAPARCAAAGTQALPGASPAAPHLTPSNPPSLLVDMFVANLLESSKQAAKAAAATGQGEALL